MPSRLATMGDVVQDVAMGDGPGQEDENQLPLSNDEQRALALYDQLQQLRVELAIINAQASYRQGTVITPHAESFSLTRAA